MNVIFKDVGQGDSIIIEWEIDTTKKVGIIDCSKKGKANPVVDHINNGGYHEIEFIILSHPHSDHYSGFLELLSLIESRAIIVNRFGFTLKEIGIEFWKWFEVTPQETKVLEEIILSAKRLRDEVGLIKKIVPIEEDWAIPLSKDIEIRSIAPSFKEIQKYQELIKFGFEFEKQASKAANYLSTIFWIRKENKHILLTSDAVKESFERLHSEGRFHGVEFELCQAPHHGSFNNYSDVFWNNIQKPEVRNVLISSGLHESYKHPHLATVKAFIDNGYHIHPTNVVYGIEEYLEMLVKETYVLDTISEIDENSMVGGDKIFSF